jgi:hypothetical protein
MRMRALSFGFGSRSRKAWSLYARALRNDGEKGRRGERNDT